MRTTVFNYIECDYNPGGVVTVPVAVSSRRQFENRTSLGAVSTYVGRIIIAIPLDLITFNEQTQQVFLEVLPVGVKLTLKVAMVNNLT